jgi:hypothetical protein
MNLRLLTILPLALLALACGDSAKARHIAELRGKLAGARMEITLQWDRLKEVEASIQSSPPPGTIDAYGRIRMGPSREWFRQSAQLRERVISLQVEIARLSAELESLGENPLKQP